MLSELLSSLLAYRYVFFTIFLAHLLYNKYGQGISKYPGPFMASLTNWYRFYDVWANSGDLPMVELHKKYGKIVRYGPKMLSISDLGAINDIYVGSDPFMKSDYYKVDDIYLKGVKHHTMFSTRDEKWHAKMKRAIGPAFTMTSIAGMENYVDQTIEFFMETIAARFVADSSGEPINLLIWIQYFAFDVLGELLWGKRHGCIEKGTDVDNVIGLANFASTYSYIVGQLPSLDKLLFKNPLLIFAQVIGLMDATYAIFPYAEKEIRAREGRVKANVDAEGSNADLLDRMLALQQKNPNLLNDTEIKKICAMLVFAGSDTTAATISILLYYIMRNPSAYAKLQAEIDAAMPIESSASISFSKAQTLPYLEACIKETFRIHPATGFNLERVVPAGGRKVSGEFLPAGTIVSVSQWALHRTPEIFGEDIESFKPERWLEDKEKANEMAKSLFHFGAGNTGCIGRNISFLEIYKLVPVLLRSYKMEIIGLQAQGPLKTYNTSFMKPVDLRAKLTPR